MTVRLNKALSLLGICSRRDADKYITQGLVQINGQAVKALGTMVGDEDTITFDNRTYNLKNNTPSIKIWLYYKKVGLITTHKDPQNRRTVFEELKPHITERVISVGRLDINSEGLLLLTNNNDYARYAESPKTGWKRVYRVRVFGKITDSIKARIEKGLKINDIQYAPMEIKIIQTSHNSQNFWCECILYEGKNREIRRIFEYFGLMVNKLIRIQYGPYELHDMKPGEIRKVKPHPETIF